MDILLIIFLLSALFAIFFAGKAYWCFKTGDIWNVSFGICAFVAFAIAFALTPESHKNSQELRNMGNQAHEVFGYRIALEFYIKQNGGSFPPKEKWKTALIQAIIQSEKELINDPTINYKPQGENPYVKILTHSKRNIAYNSYLVGKTISEVKPAGLVTFAESNVDSTDPVFRSVSELIADQMGVNGVLLEAGEDKNYGPWLRQGRIDASNSFDTGDVSRLNPPNSPHPLIVLLGKGIHYLGLILGVIFFGLGASGLLLGNEKVSLAGLYLSGFAVLLVITLCLPYYQDDQTKMRRGFPSSMTRLP
jgi:hypothetical protein